MPLNKLEHYLVLTDDVDGTRDFYCRVLGMVQGPRPPLDFAGYWLYLGDVPCIHIADWEEYRVHSQALGIPVTTRAPGTGPLDHMAFNGTDCADIRARLAAHGIAAHENYVPGPKMYQFFFNDPNGVKIELNVIG